MKTKKKREISIPFIYPNIYALNIQLIRTVTLHAGPGISYTFPVGWNLYE